MRLRTCFLTVALLAAGLPASAQTLTLAPTPWQHFTNSTGVTSAAFACLYTYVAGSTTPLATYTDSAGSVANGNPIELDSAGNVPSGFFLQPTSYRFDLKNAGASPGCSPAGSLIRSQDNVRSISPFANLDISGTAGEALAAGNVVYLSNGSGALTAGRWYKADATNAYSSTTATLVGMVPNAVSSGVSGTIRLGGSLTMPSASLTAGTDYYASGTPGALTSTAPARARLVGRADTTQTILLRLQYSQDPSLPLSTCEGRITLTAATPVTTADVTAATAVKWTPYKGNRCPLYDGTTWQTLTFAELSLALGTDTTGFNYDLFGFISSGAWAIERLVWTNDTTRATTLTLQDGVLVKTGDATRRYLGTYRTTGAGQTEDSFAKGYVWNYYNRVSRWLNVTEATGNWTYTTAAYRQTRASAANQVTLVVGVAEEKVTIYGHAGFSNTNTGVQIESGIGNNSTSTPAAGALAFASITTAAIFQSLDTSFREYPSVGLHTYMLLEYSAATGTTTWYGNDLGGGTWIKAEWVH